MRTCKTCGEAKPLDEFEILNAARGWRRGVCKPCKAEGMREWASRSQDLIKANRRAYHEQNRDKVIQRVNDWVAANPGKRRQNALSYYYRLQDQAIMAYGGYKCACCGEEEPLFLSIDHVNNDGAQHRKELGSLGGHKLYKWLKEGGYPGGFQVLCMNCNHGRHRNNGVCPHHEGAPTRPRGAPGGAGRSGASG
jgi:hypothetical protein